MNQIIDKATPTAKQYNWNLIFGELDVSNLILISN